MKGRDRTLAGWICALLVLAGLLEWRVISVAVSASREREFWWVWFFPLVLCPLLFFVQLALLRKMRSRAQRLVTLKYLMIYLPIVLVQLLFLQSTSILQIVSMLLCVPLLIWVPFKFEKEIRRIREAEGAGAAV